jgi:hypothetical protein
MPHGMTQTPAALSLFCETRPSMSRSSMSRSKTGPLTPIVRMRLSVVLASLLLCGAAAFAQSDNDAAKPKIGPGTVVVHSKFGGQIFGFDIDQNSNEGILSEAIQTGTTLTAAVETFSQTTGKILKVVAETQTQDDFITMGVVGTSVGLFEHQHVQGGFVVDDTFNTVNPLSGNKVTGSWTPPLTGDHIIMPGGVSRSQGQPTVAVFAYDNSGNFIPWVYSSNVAANTFGPVVHIPDALNFASVPPPIAYDSATNQAILGGGDGCFGCRPVFGLVDLAAGTFSEFTGNAGFGFINGIAVDPTDGIFCTTSEDDASVEFYNLASEEGFFVALPGSGESQIFSGADVEYDPIHKYFLVAQPVSSSSSSGSTIYVYNIGGEVLETINGFNFQTGSIIGMHIALHPSTRSGYVDSANVTEIQSFTY